LAAASLLPRQLLAQWEQGIEWCEKAVVNNHDQWYKGKALAGLAVADAWIGHDKEAIC
jgi:hypothetical protein